MSCRIPRAHLPALLSFSYAHDASLHRPHPLLTLFCLSLFYLILRTHKAGVLCHRRTSFLRHNVTLVDLYVLATAIQYSYTASRFNV